MSFCNAWIKVAIHFMIRNKIPNNNDSLQCVYKLLISQERQSGLVESELDSRNQKVVGSNLASSNTSWKWCQIRKRKKNLGSQQKL